MRSYEAARGLLGFLGFLAWCAIVVGIVVAIGAGSAVSQARNFGVTGGAMAGMMAAMPGLILAFIGFLALAQVQMGRAGVDTAEYTQQILTNAPAFVTEPPFSPDPDDLMRVSIAHNTIRKGFLFKTTYYEVALSVALTQEEKQIIRKRNVQKAKLVDRRPATARNDDRDEKFELRVEHLMNGRIDRFLCATPSKAKIYEEDLFVMLRQMKRWLSDNAETGSGTVIEI